MGDRTSTINLAVERSKFKYNQNPKQACFSLGRMLFFFFFFFLLTNQFVFKKETAEKVNQAIYSDTTT